MSYGTVVKTTKRLKIFEVAEDVYACITPNKGWGWVDNCFITRGKGLVYDTFYDLPHAHEMLGAYKELKGDDQPGFVVNSHYNGDHLYGNQLFPNSAIIMHEKVLEEIKGEPLSLVQDIYAARNDPDAEAYLKYFARDMYDLDFRGIQWKAPDILVSTDTKQLEILLEGMRVQILNVAPAHSQSDLLLWLPEERVVCCGDIVFQKGGMVAYTEDGIKNWSKALDFIVSLDPRVVVPGHGGLCGKAHVKELSQYFTDILEQINAFYTEGIDSFELAKKLELSKYMHWLQPERAMSIVHSICRSRSGLPPFGGFAELIPQIMRLEAYYKERYRDVLKPWDPMLSWAEAWDCE